MLDKLMAFLQDKFQSFFAWWENLTGLKYKFYEKLGFGVNWPIVSFALLIMVAMVVFLPGGLLF